MRIRQFILSLLFLNSLMVPAYANMPPAKEMQFIYTEIYPNTETVLSFETDAACEGAYIELKEFKSTENYLSVDKPGTKVPVRIVNIYASLAHTAAECKNGERKTLRKSLKVPAIQHMTHCYIVFSKDLKVSSKQQFKPVTRNLKPMVPKSHK